MHCISISAVLDKSGFVDGDMNDAANTAAKGTGCAAVRDNNRTLNILLDC